jgi:hypothetical protein
LFNRSTDTVNTNLLGIKMKANNTNTANVSDVTLSVVGNTVDTLLNDVGTFKMAAKQFYHIGNQFVISQSNSFFSFVRISNYSNIERLNKIEMAFRANDLNVYNNFDARITVVGNTSTTNTIDGYGVMSLEAVACNIASFANRMLTVSPDISYPDSIGQFFKVNSSNVTNNSDACVLVTKASSTYALPTYQTNTNTNPANKGTMSLMASKIDIGNLADEICLGTSNMYNVENTLTTTTADFALGMKKNRKVIGNSQSDVYINGTLHYDANTITTVSNAFDQVMNADRFTNPRGRNRPL